MALRPAHVIMALESTAVGNLLGAGARLERVPPRVTTFAGLARVI
jgi:hypothetical protein